MNVVRLLLAAVAIGASFTAGWLIGCYWMLSMDPNEFAARRKRAIEDVHRAPTTSQTNIHCRGTVL